MKQLLVGALACALSSSLFALSADELIKKNIEARGGLEAAKSIQNITRTGTAMFQAGDFSIEFAVTSKLARPNKMRTEAVFQGMTQVSAFDGKDSWTISPFQGRVDPQRNSADDAKLMKVAADMDGVLIDAAAKGYQVDYLGLEDVDGTNAHKLRVKLNDTDTRFVFLDPDHFLEIRFEDRVQMRGAETVMRTDLGDYEKVNGWYVPFFVEQDGQKISFDKAEINQTLDDTQFSFPVKK
jgi:outer membrane lipoprotein-sorting protein